MTKKELQVPGHIKGKCAKCSLETLFKYDKPMFGGFDLSPVKYMNGVIRCYHCGTEYIEV